jgi:hypothetical protein
MSDFADWRKPLRRMTNRLTRLQNLESRVGADVIKLHFENGGALAVPITTQLQMQLVCRLMARGHAVVEGEALDPDPQSDKLLALFARSTRAVGRGATASSLRNFARHVQHEEKNGDLVFLGNGRWRELGSGRVLDEELNEVILPEDQRVETGEKDDFSGAGN